MRSFAPPSTPAAAARRHARRGSTLVEVMVASTLLVLVCAASTQTFGYINRRAAISRLGVNARTVVERNITRALNSPFSATQLPALLGITSASGTVFDEDGNGDNVVALMIQEAGGPTLIPATLTRTVVAISNPENTDVRQVTIRINYTYRGKAYVYQMCTARARG